jgi:glycosyltransferase involved in cell wall biosynthesis
VTPPAWFEGWDHNLVHGLAWGRAQLSVLARRCHLGVADSAFNAAELRAYGFRHTEVLPILVDPAALVTATDAGTSAGLRAGKAGTDWLFVGRLAPNKCQHDLVKAFALYRRAYDPHARLWLVGGASADSYRDAVRHFADDAGVGDGVTLTGPVSDGELAAYYDNADVFVCLSEHEGFLVPLLEAWAHRLPVVAYAAAAVPETMGEGGLVLTDKTPTTVAAAVRRLVTDTALRQALVRAGEDRLATFSLGHTSQRLLELANRLAEGAADRPRPW